MVWLLTLILWVFLSVIVGKIAESRGRSFWAFLLGSLVFSPLIFLIVLLVMGQDEEKAAERSDSRYKCPQCAEFIQIEAKVCRFCGYDQLDPPATGRVVAESGNHWRFWEVLVGALVIGIVILLLTTSLKDISNFVSNLLG